MTNRTSQSASGNPHEASRPDTENGVAVAAPAVVPAQWLWRVFNQGWPKGHPDSTNEWGPWNLISEADARRLASEDDTDCYEFVPYRVDHPAGASGGIPEQASGYLAGAVNEGTK